MILFKVAKKDWTIRCHTGGDGPGKKETSFLLRKEVAPGKPATIHEARALLDVPGRTIGRHRKDRSKAALPKK